MSKVVNQKVTNDYAMFHADCVPALCGMPDNSLHFSISSWPFVGMYQYTDDPADMSNVIAKAQFFEGVGFMLCEFARVMMPGRLVAVHCMQIPKTIEHDGVIGLDDFRGDIIRAFERHGFIYHSEVAIWKDPLIAATRTHAIGLAHKQIVKDSAICRNGILDYLVVVRKPGVNPEPIPHGPSGFTRYIGAPEDEPKQEKKTDPAVNKYSHEVWQRYASGFWMDINPSDTLQKESAREKDDTRHICPLQLTVIRRAVELWSNPGDVVFDPFTGIGSTGCVSLEEGRRFVGCELKATYYAQAVRNLDAVLERRTQASLDLQPMIEPPPMAELEDLEGVPEWQL